MTVPDVTWAAVPTYVWVVVYCVVCWSIATVWMHMEYLSGNMPKSFVDEGVVIPFWIFIPLWLPLYLAFVLADRVARLYMKWTGTPVKEDRK